MEFDLASIITNAARRNHISADLIAGIAMQESSGKPWAMRAEEGFFNHYIKDKPLNGFQGELWDEYERAMRSCSFGLMQVMGNTAREFGFQGHLHELLEPVKSVNWGTKIFAHHLHETQDTIKALLRYNGGGDPEYPDKVFERIDSGEIRLILPA
jgi:soluble lytic murein transglycosylase-like protein